MRTSIMSSITARDLEAMLGEVDALIVERIIETQATPDEVAEALADVEEERRFGDRPTPTSGRVAQVREILEELLDEDEPEEA